jgi:arginyl-tRNA--protein-N-Asp/Glu arginylyltransferase
MNKNSVQLGLTPEIACPYLSEQKERLGLVIDAPFLSQEGYDLLIQQGFRRTGDNIYRPYCKSCQACQSLRVNVKDFMPSKSQKRHLKQLAKLKMIFKHKLDANWFSLYERYINLRHHTGSMYPANKTNFIDFTHSQWQKVMFMHLYENEQLIAIAVTDVVSSGLSALYTFFEPTHPYSLGSLCILAQLAKTKQLDLPWLYLGFQIDACQTMKYKTKFKPHERFIKGKWEKGAIN